ncbi:hypothetical protein Taro_013106 [Colocasia esculenta]|uniref:J domain-containing protein n=1 Tax=Colocasia esculenta TaxID=4460 RepID=A0A843UFJ9_COLES|nr:hypothetical protein [Colocasia esculenta]
MECNRDEALRAKELAESKFMTKDIEGAKRLALKAENLFPGLDGISHMIATLDVHLSAQAVVNGEKDWYSILGVHVSADDETVKKQYRKLALLLHPDKNKSVGAEGAFKLISEAWSVLSDKSRRMAYDRKRNIKGYQPKTSHHKRNNSHSHGTGGFYHFTKTGASGSRTQKATSCAAPPVVPHPNTFWTVCNECKMQYEYLRIYLNHNLLCPSCHEPFLATEIPVPTNGPNSPIPWVSQQCNAGKNAYGPGKSSSTIPGMRPNGFQHGSNCDMYTNPNFQWGAFSRTAGAASAAASFSAAAQTVNTVHQAYEKVRRERKEAEAAKRREEVFQRKNHMSSKSTNAEVNNNWEYPKVDGLAKKRKSMGDDGRCRAEDSEGKTVIDNANRIYNNAGLSETDRVNSYVTEPGKVRLRQSKEFQHIDIRNLLLRKAKMMVQRKLEELNSVTVIKSAEKEEAKEKQKLKDGEKDKEIPEVNLNRFSDKSEAIKKKKVHGKMIPSSDVCVETQEEVQEPITITVPDPDFHDFDMDRSERSFAADQVWATYDDEDGMPRLYVMVQKVVSLKPFRVRLSFLNSKTNSEFGELNWVGSGFAKTCGDFRIGRYEIRDTVNIFSHRVKWEKGSRGVIRILPHKGDIWAIYRNWSPDWNEHTPDDVLYKYDMVEVLDDYTEDEGVSVTPLVKVAGFKTIFHRHLDPKEVKKIPKKEMFRFSHQVPSYVLTGEEAENAPKGCCELDPAATPSELLQVMTEAVEGLTETAERPSAT